MGNNNLNGYLAFCDGHEQTEIYAETMFEAKEKAVAHFKSKTRRWSKAKEYSVHVHLCELAGKQVVHNADF